jgi:hypothetical protein
LETQNTASSQGNTEQKEQFAALQYYTSNYIKEPKQ